MQIFEYSPGNAVVGDGYVVALGFFDGVHVAHRALIQTAKSIAVKKRLPLAVFTFLSEDEKLKSGDRIYSTGDKLEIFASLGVDLVILSRFASVSDLSAEEFIHGPLLRDMKCRVAVAGFDYRFGKGAAGNVRLLESHLKGAGAEFVMENEHKIDGEKISTTNIKSLLRAGKVDEAARYLGTPYFIKTEVTHGDGRGKNLGFPTLNSEIDPPLRRGVYRTAVEISGRAYHAITNVGTCPTFGEREAHVETYVIGFSGDLYGQNVRTYFLGFLRDEKTFRGAEELREQLNLDKERAMRENGDIKWLEIGQS